MPIQRINPDRMPKETWEAVKRGLGIKIDKSMIEREANAAKRVGLMSTETEKADNENDIKSFIPFLEKTIQPGLWQRGGLWQRSSSNDAFVTGVVGTCSGALPEGIYEITIFKTGKITVESLKAPLEGGAPVTFSAVGDEFREIYLDLEDLERIENLKS